MQDYKYQKQFNKCTTKRTRKNGNTSINCKLGLWGVSAPNEDQAQAIIEALRYWHQYKEDGEYSEIIGGKSVIDNQLNSKKYTEEQLEQNAVDADSDAYWLGRSFKITGENKQDYIDAIHKDNQ